MGVADYVVQKNRYIISSYCSYTFTTDCLASLKKRIDREIRWYGVVSEYMQHYSKFTTLRV